MLISCENCGASYTLSVEELGPNGKKLKCARCASIWLAKPPISQPKKEEVISEKTTLENPPIIENPAPKEDEKSLPENNNSPLVIKAETEINRLNKSTPANYLNIILLKFSCFTLFFIAVFLSMIIFYSSFYEYNLLKNLYKNLGFAKTENLIITDLSLEQKNDNLSFKANIYNKGDKDSNIPLLKISIKDEKEKELFSHIIETKEKTIKAGKKISIDNNISHLNSKAAFLELDIGNKIELLQR